MIQWLFGSRSKPNTTNTKMQPPKPRQTLSTTTYLSSTSEFQGNLNVDGDLNVHGIVHGTVQVSGDIEVSETGLIEGAELRGNNIVLHGVVKARVIAEGQLTLSHTARLEGDVTAQSLNVEAGAFYVGYITTSEPRGLPAANPLPELIGHLEQMES